MRSLQRWRLNSFFVTAILASMIATAAIVSRRRQIELPASAAKLPLQAINSRMSAITHKADLKYVESGNEKNVESRRHCSKSQQQGRFRLLGMEGLSRQTEYSGRPIEQRLRLRKVLTRDHQQVLLSGPKRRLAMSAATAQPPVPSPPPALENPENLQGTASTTDWIAGISSSTAVISQPTAGQVIWASGPAGADVILDASKSSAEIGAVIQSYSWIITGPAGIKTTAEGQRASLRLSAGSYSAQLAISTTSGAARDEVVFEVQQLPQASPPAAAAVTAPVPASATVVPPSSTLPVVEIAAPGSTPAPAGPVGPSTIPGSSSSSSSAAAGVARGETATIPAGTTAGSNTIVTTGSTTALGAGGATGSTTSSGSPVSVTQITATTVPPSTNAPLVSTAPAPAASPAAAADLISPPPPGIVVSPPETTPSPTPALIPAPVNAPAVTPSVTPLAAPSYDVSLTPAVPTPAPVADLGAIPVPLAGSPTP